MKKLILARHATAQSQTGENDLSRKLVAKGHVESQNIAFLLAKLHIKIDLIVTSHADRAVETAEHIQKIAYRKITRLVDNALYSGGKSNYLATINQLEDSCNSVLLIGHNPVIKEVAAYFVNSEGSTITFPKASVYVFTIDCDSWKEVENNISQLSCFISRGDIQKLLEHPDDK